MEAVSRLPREAFRYWPSGNQVLIGSGRFAQRLIFHRQTYKPEEESAIEALINRIEPSNVSRADLLRVLYAANWDIDRAAKQLEALLIWPKWVQSRTLPPSLLSAILDSGGIYTHGKDCFYRPLVVLVPSVLLQLPYSTDEIMHAAAYFFTFIEQKMLLPGQIESWVVLLDCAGAVTCPAVLVWYM